MKEQLALLRELQQIDMELDEITQQKEEIRSHLDGSKSDLQRLVAELGNQREELQEIRTLRDQKRTELTEVQENLKERKKRLLNVGSTKEYNAVEKEIDALQKSAETTEEELLHLAEVLENNEGQIAQKEAMTQKLSEGIAQAEADASGQLEEFEAKIDAFQKRTAAARSEVSKRVLHTYDFIRSRRPGLAVVAARGGYCTGCFMALPPQLYIQVQRGETLERCQSCQRLLYYEEAAVEVEVTAESA